MDNNDFFFAKEDYNEFNINKWFFFFFIIILYYLIRQNKYCFDFISMTKILNAFIVLIQNVYLRITDVSLNILQLKKKKYLFDNCFISIDNYIYLFLKLNLV